MTLATFGFIGPPIGVTLCLLGLWLGDAIKAPSGMIQDGLSGLAACPAIGRCPIWRRRRPW
jgi:hypothetical protein